jgi:hypothetical protein
MKTPRKTTRNGDEPPLTNLQRFARWLWEYLRSAFGGDKRSMALFRMGLALTVLGDVTDRLWDLRSHYTDAGVFPRTEALTHFTNGNWFIIHMVTGKTDVMALIFVVHLLCAFCLLIGFYTRTFTFLVWLLQNSLNSRNILVLHGGDVYLRAALFWAMWMPLGSCCSIDRTFYKAGSNRKKGFFRDYRFLCAGTAAMVMQVSLMYWTSVYHKTGDEWVKDATATFYALQLDYFRMPLGDLFLSFHPHVLPTLTTSVYYWEWLGSLCFFTPFQIGFFRTFGVFGFMAMHLGFALCLRLGTFFWIAMAGLTPLLPTWFWETLVFRFIRKPERTNFELYYTTVGRWHFYERFAKVLATFFLLPEADVRPLRQLLLNPSSSSSSSSSSLSGRDEEEGLMTSDMGSAGHLGGTEKFSRNFVGGTHEYRDACLVAVDHNGVVHKDYDALVATCEASPLLWPVGRMLAYMRRKPQLFESAAFFGLFINIFLETIVIFCIGAPKNNLKKKDKSPEIGHSILDDETKAAFEEYSVDKAAGAGGNGGSDGAGMAGGGHKRNKYVYAHKWLGKKGINYFRPYSRLKRFLSLKTIWLVVETLIVLWFAALVFEWNMGNIGYSHWAPASDVRWVAYAVHLDQQWSMFAPRPPNIHWWYIIQGWLVDGTELELHRNRGMWNWEGNPLDNWDKPSPFYPSYGNHRWFKFYEQMNSHQQNQAIRLEYGRFICREWNARHREGQILYEFKIWWVNEFQKLDGTREPRPKQMLWHHICLDKKPVWPPPANENKEKKPGFFNFASRETQKNNITTKRKQ